MNLLRVASTYGAGGIFVLLFTSILPLHAQVFVLNQSGSSISEYNSSGSVIKSNLVTDIGFPFQGDALATDGTNLFVAISYPGSVAEYSSSGNLYSSNLGSASFADGVAVSGSNLYVSAESGIEQFTLGTSPGTVTSSNPSFITGLANPGSLAVAGSNLFVDISGSGKVAEYNVNGTLENGSLINTGLGPGSLAVVGSQLFVIDGYGVEEYTLGSTPGTIVSSNPSLIKISGSGPNFIFSDGSHLFVETNDSVAYEYGTGTVGEYNLDGTAVNASLITGLQNPYGLVVDAAPELSTWTMLLVGLGILSLFSIRFRRI
jgi:hypothetical protein